MGGLTGEQPLWRSDVVVRRFSDEMTDESPPGGVEGISEEPDPVVEPKKRPSLSDYGYRDDSPKQDNVGITVVLIAVVVLLILGGLWFWSLLGCMDMTAGCT